MRVYCAILLAAAAAIGAAEPSPCDADAPFALTLEATGDSLDETALLMRGCEDEACICGAMRLGWSSAAKAGVRGRKSRAQSIEAVRRFAQGTVQNASAVLARVHPRYPTHVKFIPALEWAQSADVVQVRLRHARYTRGEMVFGVPELTQTLLTDDALRYSAEGSDKPGSIDTTLRWWAPLARRDGCADGEAGCPQWAAAGECEAEPHGGGGPSMRERCAKSCGLCAELSGSEAGGVVAAWRQLPSGLLLEVRKAVQRPWPRLMAEAKPVHRIVYLEEERASDAADGNASVVESKYQVGALLECHEGCIEGSACALGEAGAECVAECMAVCGARSTVAITP